MRWTVLFGLVAGALMAVFAACQGRPSLPAEAGMVWDHDVWDQQPWR